MNQAFTRLGRFWSPRLLAAGLLLAGSLPLAWAEDIAQLTQVRANPIDNQVTVSLSIPKTATLSAPLEKGKRYLLIDIPDASLGDLRNKAILIQEVENLLPDIAQVSLDEFRGSSPVVRIRIRTRSPEITGALTRTSGDTLVLQLLHPMNQDTPSAATDAANGIMTATNDTPPTPPRAMTDTPSPTSSVQGDDTLPRATLPLRESVPELALSGKTSVDVLDVATRRKLAEADLVRKRRNELEDMVKSLKITMDQQNEMIAHLKAEQGNLTVKPPNAQEKQTIVALEKSMKELQAGYDDLNRSLQTSEARVKTLESDLAQTRELNDGLTQKLNASPDAVEAPGEARAGLLNTLGSLSANEVSRLVNAEKAFRSARSEEFKGDMKKAEADYQKALSLSPQVQDYALSLSALYIKQKDYAHATAVLLAALKYHPDDSALLNELGKLALIQKQDVDALAYFKKAVPSSILNNYASTLRRLDKPTDAEMLYKVALAADPKDSDVVFNLGNLYLTQKRYSDAETRFTEAIQLNPNFSEAFYQLGLTYAQQAKAALAIDSFREYLRLQPQASNQAAVRSYIKDLEVELPTSLGKNQPIKSKR